MRTLTRVIVAVALTVAACASNSATTFEPVELRPGGEFFDPPNPLPDGDPGGLVRAKRLSDERCRGVPRR